MSAQGSQPPRVWYTRPAERWMEALPLGNGRLGAMVFGHPEHERILLNEISLWSGRPQAADRREAGRHIGRIRELLLAGRYVEAQALADRHLRCAGGGTFVGDSGYQAFGTYEPLGTLSLFFGGRSWRVADYRRELDLDAGIARVSYRGSPPNGREWTGYTRELFISHPDRALALRLTAGRRGALDVVIRLAREREAEVAASGSDGLVLRGRLGRGLRFECRLQVRATGGRRVRQDGALWVRDADAVEIRLVANTDFGGVRPDSLCRAQLEAAAARSFARLRARHVADHRRLFRRVQFELAGDTHAGRPTDECLLALRKRRPDEALVPLYFHYGRYLLMASSRPGGLPSNLQGLWNPHYHPAWNCDYHFNVNTQMNYWLAEPGNLAECHAPLLDYIESLRRPGRRTARVSFKARGWCVNWCSNIWGFTAPGENLQWGLFPEAGAWLCRHLWEHYAFSGDKAFLETVYPTLAEAAAFCLDNLAEHPRRKGLVFGPSVAPEKGYRIRGRRVYVAMGTAASQQIVGDLLAICARAAKTLGRDAARRRVWMETRARLAQPGTAPDGSLREWIDPVRSDGQFHMRHVYAAYPGEQVTPGSATPLARALRRTVRQHMAHGRQSYWGWGSWFAGWLVNLLARFGDGDAARAVLFKLLTSCTAPNLFDRNGAHFQIDGNLGAAAGIAELLLQSHAGVVRLLPALPRAWAAGRICGLRARGGFKADIEWSAGRLVRASLRSLRGAPCTLAAPGPVRIACNGRPVPATADGPNWRFETRKGARYEIRPR